MWMNVKGLRIRHTYYDASIHREIIKEIAHDGAAGSKTAIFDDSEDVGGAVLS